MNKPLYFKYAMQRLKKTPNNYDNSPSVILLLIIIILLIIAYISSCSTLAA